MRCVTQQLCTTWQTTQNSHKRPTTAAGICNFFTPVFVGVVLHGEQVACDDNTLPHAPFANTERRRHTPLWWNIHKVSLAHTYTRVSRVEPLKGQRMSGTGGPCNSEWNPHLPFRGDCFLPSSLPSFLPSCLFHSPIILPQSAPGCFITLIWKQAAMEAMGLMTSF